MSYILGFLLETSVLQISSRSNHCLTCQSQYTRMPYAPKTNPGIIPKDSSLVHIATLISDSLKDNNTLKALAVLNLSNKIKLYIYIFNFHHSSTLRWPRLLTCFRIENKFILATCKEPGYQRPRYWHNYSFLCKVINSIFNSVSGS